MKRSSERMSRVQAPIIPVVGDWIRANPGTISLGQGIVHYPPPPSIETYIKAFWDDPLAHQYGPVEGLDPLREAIAQKVTAENGVDISGREIAVTAGSNMGFLNMLLAISDPGDEIILPRPFYFNQEMAVRIANCEPIFVDTDSQGHLDLDAIKEALTEKTRAVVTVSPNNPTGVVYREDDLRSVNALCKSRGVYHISDEAYEYFLYDGDQHFSPASIPGSEDHTISLYSLSKAYGFASWRIGYAVMPRDLFGALRKVQDTNVICATAISQYAAVGALKEGAPYCQQFVGDMAKVREQGVKALKTLGERVKPLASTGAFYFFVELPGFSGDDLALIRTLIEEHKVAVIPGSAFGITDRCAFRASFGALKTETAIEGLGRLISGLDQLI
ncbi:MAG: pyridoxal phosphate-dependent aminotransferase [Arenicellales bacterium]|jgi:aspartate/methionine/tyrosine aminotransferase